MKVKSCKMKVYVAGHRGMVGNAICRQLNALPDIELITMSHSKLDLLDQWAVRNFFKLNKPDVVILCAAKVGGIYANNKYPADFIYQNLQIQNNVIHQAHLSNIDKLLFLGSSCIYPKYASQPIDETELMNGVLEKTNEPYAIAKIAGIKMCESYSRQYDRDYRSIMPTNLYGPGDNFHPLNSHVVPALFRRFHEAKLSGNREVSIWGGGEVKREFLFVDDMASASIFIINLKKEIYLNNVSSQNSHLNVGTGIDVTIKELAYAIKDAVGYNGEILFDKTKPEGTPRKLLNVNKLKKIGWQYKTNLKEGLKITNDWILENPNCLSKF
jgi:GDP-L-fucose synthase